MPTLVIRFPDGREEEMEVANALTIGRAEGNDLILTEGGVSRQHARFFVEGGALQVEDLGSSNGTWVDGEKIEGPTAVTAKNQVVIGDYELAVKLGSKPRPKATGNAGQGSTRATGILPKTASRPGGAPPRSTKVMPVVRGKPDGAALAKRPATASPRTAAAPTLRVMSGALVDTSFTLSGTMIVGRVATADIHIDDDSISRRHAEVTVVGRTAKLKDLDSANGTTVNGAPITEETTLAAGDIIQFGVVEVVYEGPAGSGTRLPVRRADGASRETPGAPEAGAPAPNPRKKLILAGVAVVALLFVMIVIKAATAPAEDPKPQIGKGSNKPKPPPDPAQEIDRLLTEARSYAGTSLGTPDWDKADQLVKQILELEPIHAEANQLAKQIVVERKCDQGMKAAQTAVRENRNADAVEAYSKITSDCPTYFLTARAESKAPIAEVKKSFAESCKTYANAAKYDNAIKACEGYMRLACQTMGVDELYVPAGFKLKLDGSLGKTDWRPKDPTYVTFLKVREKLKLTEPGWSCPEIPVFRLGRTADDPTKLAKEEFSKRYPDAEIGRALALYFDGKFDQSYVPLQQIKANVSKAPLHDMVGQMLTDIQTCASLFKDGQTNVANEKPERAEDQFRRALAIDERLVLGDKVGSLTDEQKVKELAKRQSTVRRTIIEVMTGATLSKGKALAERKDLRGACKMWKMGMSFSRGNADLLKAVLSCTKKASEAFARAEECDDYNTVLEFAVDGDGYKEKVDAARTEKNCTP